MVSIFVDTLRPEYLFSMLGSLLDKKESTTISRKKARKDHSGFTEQLELFICDKWCLNAKDAIHLMLSSNI